MAAAKKPSQAQAAPVSPAPVPPVSAATVDTLAAIDPVADLLGGGRIVAFRVDLALAVGGISAGLLLSQFWFWTNSHRTELRDGWFWMTCAQISEQTGLTREEQNTARKRLRDLRVLEEDKRGVPMKIWFRVQKPQLIALLRGYVQANSYLQVLPQDELKGMPEAQLEGFPSSGNPSSYLSVMPKERVGQYRKIARGKAQSLLSGIPEDITEISSEISPKNSPPISTKSNPGTLNVPGDENRQQSPDSDPSEEEESADAPRIAAVWSVLAITGDTKSAARFAQLYDICDEQGERSAWDEALASTGKAKAMGRLRGPAGAYFNGTLAKILLKHGISVPIGSAADREALQADILASLGLNRASDDGESGEKAR